MRLIRAAQIHSVSRLVPVTMSINLINAMLVLLVFWDGGSHAFLLAWFGALGVVAGAGGAVVAEVAAQSAARGVGERDPANERAGADPRR